MKKIVFLLIVVLLFTGCNQIDEVSSSNTPTNITTPTAVATATLTAEATSTPTLAHTPTATVVPTATPKSTAKPTAKPTVKPTAKPTVKPTAKPTATPTAKPTPTPTPSGGSASCSHIYSGWITTKYPTTTEEGQQKNSCMYCGHTIYQSIPQKEEVYAGLPDSIIIQQAALLTAYKNNSCTLKDYRKWGDTPEIIVLSDESMKITYYNKNNEKISFTLYATSTGIAVGNINDDGTYDTYVLDGIG